MPRFPAFFASIIRERSLCAALLGAGCVLIMANMLHFTVWICAFRQFTGLPCPGCGMTRAMSALCRGHFIQSLALHPFAPGIALAGIILVLATVLPAVPRRRLIEGVAAIERRTGISAIFVIAMLLWGIWRMTHEGAAAHWPFLR